MRDWFCTALLTTLELFSNHRLGGIGFSFFFFSPSLLFSIFRFTAIGSHVTGCWGFPATLQDVPVFIGVGVCLHLQEWFHPDVESAHFLSRTWGVFWAFFFFF